MNSRTDSKAEKDRQKQIQDKCQTLLTEMLRDEDNKYCVDCDAKGKESPYQFLILTSLETILCNLIMIHVFGNSFSL